MADPHPLTQEMCDDIRRVSKASIIEFTYEDLRAAWDAGVQAVIDFLESGSCSDYPGTLYYPTHGDDESIAEAIHRAIYTQEDSQ